MTHNIYNHDTDFTKDAAHHLREKAKERGIKIGSSHAHALVAASLGYKSRAALLADNSNHCVDDPWLSREDQDKEQICATIERMKNTEITAGDTEFIASTIRDGLTPTCTETGIRSADNIPLGDVEPGDDAEWVHPSAISNTDEFGHCRCCGSDVFYRLGDLDDEMLCENHRGEFDLDPEEQKDWDDFIEYQTKDN
ncbi:MAG: hypothetical protein IBX56_09025 [Methylomicrobium sp.]|nr:hypothetical protein [Methylomicrobium sp.]